MGQFDGSYLGSHSGMSSEFIKTAVNLLEHCRLVSLGNRESARVYLERDETDPDYSFTDKYRIDTPFSLVGGSFIRATESSSQALAYIAENPWSLVVAFRGSGVKKKSGKLDVRGTFNNAIADLRVNLIRNRHFPGKIHRGFSSEYQQLRQEIHERFEQTDYRKRSKNIYVTGFSLGGALATLCAYDLAENFPIKPHCYLFAAPAVGNHDFTRRVENRLQNIFRFAHEKDIVPQIPHSLFCTYKATGNKLLIFNDKAKQVHHNKIKMALKAKRVARALLRKVLNPAQISPVLIIALVKVAYGFKYHSPEYYKKKLAKFYLNYNESRNRNSNLRQAADSHYQECQHYCIDL